MTISYFKTIMFMPFKQINNTFDVAVKCFEIDFINVEIMI